MEILKKKYIGRHTILNKLSRLKNNHLLLKAIGINIIYFIVMEGLFKVVWSVDNATISNVMYGAYDWAYDYHASYISFSYAKIVVFFLNCFSGLPWYTILEDIWLFIAFTLTTYIIFEKYNNSFGTILNVILLTFFTYEGYACPQFTKTAEILSIAGVFAIFCFNKRVFRVVLGAFLFILGALIRLETVRMTLGAWGIVLLIKITIAFVKKSKELIKKNAALIIFFLCIYILFLFISNYVRNEQIESDLWEEYNIWTYYRSRIQDYQIPDYSEYAEEYKKIGVSENDLLFWSSWNNDPDIMDIETLQNILSLRTDSVEGMLSKIFCFSNILDFLKVFPNVFLTIDVFYAYFFILIFFMLGTMKKDNIYKMNIMCSFVICMLLNYYLYINGRYLKHRVDVGIALIACLIMVYLNDGNVTLNLKKKGKNILGACICLLLSVPYKNYSDDIHPVTEEQQEKNKSFFLETNGDLEHYYTFVSDRDKAYTKFAVFDAWDCVPIGFFRNIYGGTQPTPKIKNVWKTYDITNPYLDALDNDLIYLVFDKDSSMQEAMQIYLEEHTNKEVDLILVKDYLNKEIYRAVSKPLEDIYIFDNVIDESNKLVGNIKVVVEKDEYGEKKDYLTLSGNMHIEKKSGFAQNTYLLVKDKQSEKKSVYSVEQTEDREYEKVEEGYFSRIDAYIDLPEFYDDDDDVYLLVESEGIVYRTKLLIQTKFNNK